MNEKIDLSRWIDPNNLISGWFRDAEHEPRKLLAAGPGRVSDYLNALREAVERQRMAIGIDRAQYKRQFTDLSDRLARLEGSVREMRTGEDSAPCACTKKHDGPCGGDSASTDDLKQLLHDINLKIQQIVGFDVPIGPAPSPAEPSGVVDDGNVCVLCNRPTKCDKVSTNVCNCRENVTICDCNYCHKNRLDIAAFRQRCIDAVKGCDTITVISGETKGEYGPYYSIADVLRKLSEVQ